MLTHDLYQEILLEHSKHPRGERLLAQPTHRAEAENPEAGDAVTLSLVVENGLIAQVGWEVQGSAVLKASCSLMGDFVSNKSIQEAKSEAERFRDFLTSDVQPSVEEFEHFGDVAALSGIRHLPARVKCAMLPWRAFLSIQ